ncbi:hypothetical protein OIU77_002029 [Salix suchowensis]|uniref:Uncharacterized protein n=1 Tax=Salix suchowensis TaxID=1278906 RepID=A0ABQ9B3E5_9ROSI|nr:hypothetical protein OIU77_002029 [Salix suchowensis]
MLFYFCINLEVTALKFDEDGGFTIAVGSSGGKGIDGLGMVMNIEDMGQDLMYSMAEDEISGRAESRKCAQERSLNFSTKT